MSDQQTRWSACAECSAEEWMSVVEVQELAGPERFGVWGWVRCRRLRRAMMLRAEFNRVYAEGLCHGRHGGGYV